MTIDKAKWDKVSFGDIARCLTVATKDPLSEGLDRYVGLEHIEPNNIHIKSWGDVAKGTTFTRVFRKGQVLFGKRRAYQKKAALAEFNGICSGDILVCEAIEGKLVPELLPFIVQSDHFFDFAIKTSAGSLSPRTKFKDLAKFTLKLPTKVDDQKRIADLLWSIDEAEQKQDVLIKALQSAKQAIIDGNLVNAKDKYYTLDITGDVVRGVTFGPGDIVQADNNDKVLILRANNIFNNLINYEDVIFVKKDQVSEEQILKEKDFAICMSSGSKALVGKAAEYNDEHKGAVAVGAFCSIYRLKKAGTHFDEIKYFFQSSFYRKQISLLLSGSTINNLKKSDILELRVPQSGDIKDIIAKLNKIDEQADLISKQKRKLREIKKQIINQVFGDL